MKRIGSTAALTALALLGGASGASAVELSREEARSLYTLCSPQLTLGYAAYDACLREQFERLDGVPRSLVYEALSAVDREIVNEACAAAAARGPASLRMCHRRETRQFAGTLGRPGGSARAPGAELPGAGEALRPPQPEIAVADLPPPARSRPSSGRASPGPSADRAAPAPPAVPATAARLTPTEMAQLQDWLDLLGFDAGPADGIMGSATRSAIRAFEASRGRAPSGVADRVLLAELAELGAAETIRLAALEPSAATEAPVREPFGVAGRPDTPDTGPAAPAGSEPLPANVAIIGDPLGVERSRRALPQVIAALPLTPAANVTTAERSVEPAAAAPALKSAPEPTTQAADVAAQTAARRGEGPDAALRVTARAAASTDAAPSVVARQVGAESRPATAARDALEAEDRVTPPEPVPAPGLSLQAARETAAEVFTMLFPADEPTEPDIAKTPPKATPQIVSPPARVVARTAPALPTASRPPGSTAPTRLARPQSVDRESIGKSPTQVASAPASPDTVRHSSGLRPRSQVLSILPPASVPAGGMDSEQLLDFALSSVWQVDSFRVDDAGHERIVASGSAIAVAGDRLITDCRVAPSDTVIHIRRGHEEDTAQLALEDRAAGRCVLVPDSLALDPVPGVRRFADLDVGEAVYTIGSPGWGRVLGEGVISRLSPDPTTDEPLDMTAPVMPGSVGGGLFDGNGNLIGITSGAYRQGALISSVIPAETFWQS